jgi:UDPglucose 6-dehydrogenase
MDELSIIGLGKLGACSAACFASKGFNVIGVDINKDFVDAINNGKAPVYEPGLQELITSVKGKLRATQDYEEAINESDITFLIIPTPSREDWHFSDKYLRDALSHLSSAFKKLQKKHHIFVITSTVSPGTTEESLIPLIESVSGKRLNKDFSVCYNPEFIALGSVIKDFKNPDMVLIGESNKDAGDKLEEIYKRVCENNPYISRMSIISAEITKISLNAYITMKISFANTLANICESIPGADIDAITRALGADKRISPYYLKGGLSYGGPCFPRDNKAFAAFAQKYSVDALLSRATDEFNRIQVKRLSKLVLTHANAINANAIAVLGLSYKPDTSVIEESPGVKLADELIKKGFEVVVYDPLAIDNARTYFGDSVLYVSSVKDCFSYAPLCVITTRHEVFKSIDDSYITHDPTIVIDCWRILNSSKFSNRVKYVRLGKFSR